MSYQNYVSRKEGNELGAGYVAKVREKFPSAILDEERQTADQLTITVKTDRCLKWWSTYITV